MTSAERLRGLGDVARDFVLMAIQEWGQSDGERIAAVQAVLDAAGFNARAVDFPALRRFWQREPAEGPDGEVASAWLKELVASMPHGRFENEEAHVARGIAERHQQVTGPA